MFANSSNRLCWLLKPALNKVNGVHVSGEFCESEIDPCRGVRCPSGRCVDGVCFNPCNDKPCLNRATCYIKSDASDYFCQCLPKYTGKNCETLIEPETALDTKCQQMKCQNGGVCASGKCFCPPGFNGSLCEKVLDYCSGVQCLNNGTCYSNDQSYVCVCTREYTGARCEQKRSQSSDACDSISCYNGGFCLDGQCQCPPGFSGTQCKTLIGCMSHPCKNGGQCYSNPYTYVCICPPGWTGENCDQQIAKQVEKVPQSSTTVSVMCELSG